MHYIINYKNPYKNSCQPFSKSVLSKNIKPKWTFAFCCCSKSLWLQPFHSLVITSPILLAAEYLCLNIILSPFKISSESFFPNLDSPLDQLDGNEEKLCGILKFANTKCTTGTMNDDSHIKVHIEFKDIYWNHTNPGSKQCKRCVIDKLAIDCPYPKTGNPDCEKQMACALAAQLDCPDLSK